MRSGLDRKTLKRIYGNAARRYDWLHALLTVRFDGLGRGMVVMKAVREGERVLDCGAGTGSTALLAAAKCGPGGRVVLFDLSERMLAVAREKAQAAGLEDRLDFVTGDMLRLPFPDANFDSVLSTYSLCPLDDPARGALEMYRVLRPGGRMGVAHSAEPPNAMVRWLGARVESAAWHFPSLSMGCRPVSVLLTLEKAGAKVISDHLVGVPFWPFLVLVLEKPAC